jgi:hypothetical protein
MNRSHFLRRHFLHPKTVKAGRIIALDTSIHKAKPRPQPAIWFVIFGTLFSRRRSVAGREKMQLFRVCLSKTLVGVVVTATVDNVFIFRNNVLVAAIRQVPPLSRKEEETEPPAEANCCCCCSRCRRRRRGIGRVIAILE